MDRELVLSLLYAQQGLISGEPGKYYVESPETQKLKEKIYNCLSPMNNSALDIAVAYAAEREADGFLNGFQIAVRLLRQDGKV